MLKYMCVSPHYDTVYICPLYGTVYVHERSVIETRQRKATMPEDNTSSSQEKKKSCLRRDLNP